MEYKLIGSPIKLKRHGKPSKNYYQCYKLPSDKRKHWAPCCADKQTSQRKAIQYVETHISANTPTDPITTYANATIEEHLKVYRESLEADKSCKPYIIRTISRIKRISKTLKYKTIKDIDGLALKNWISKQKSSMKTARDHLASFKAFTKFLYLNYRIETDPLARTTLKIKGDLMKAKRKRRCITPEEFSRLLKAAENGPKLLQLTGEQRKMLYILSASTGFRASECASLTPRNFNLDTDSPTVMIDCTISKRRRYDCQELPKYVADLFRVWLAEKPIDEKLWFGRLADRAAKLLRVDLKTAGIEYKNDEGIIDFHAVGRVHFITRLVSTSAPVPLIMRIARLSTPALLDRYYKPSDLARRETVCNMPELQIE